LLMRLAVRSSAYAAGAIAGVGYLYLLGVKTNMLGRVGSRGERTAALLLPLPLPLPHCRLAVAAAAITAPSCHCSAASDAAATANSTTKLPQSGCRAAATAATAALPLPLLRCCQDAAATTITTAPSRRCSTNATKLPRCNATAVVADCRPAARGGGARYCRPRRRVGGAQPRAARASFPPR
jgi:hypothetical protein